MPLTPALSRGEREVKGMGESAGDVARAAEMRAKRRLGTNVYHLRMLVDQLVDVTGQLQQIVMAMAVADGVRDTEIPRQARDDEADGDPSTGSG